MIDLAVGQAGDEIAAHPALKRLASFQHSGRVVAVEVRHAAAATRCSCRTLAACLLLHE